MLKDRNRLAKCTGAACRNTMINRLRRDIRVVARCNLRIRASASVAARTPGIKAPKPFHFFNRGFLGSIQAALQKSRAISPPAAPVPHKPFLARIQACVARVQAAARVSGSIRVGGSFSFGGIRASASISGSARASGRSSGRSSR